MLIEYFCVAQELQLCDGVILRNVRFYMINGRLDVAQEWMDNLSKPKRHNLSLILRRAKLVESLDLLLPLDHLWDDLQLGNWARHLAAHVPQLIENYLCHVRRVWLDEIFRDLSHLVHLVRRDDILSLQYRAPCWDAADRADICRGFAQGTLFSNILSLSDRKALEQNILSLGTIIPTLKTFNENMRYIAIGAKILERHIETVPRKRSAAQRDTIQRQFRNLSDNLQADWFGSCGKAEISHGQFRAVSSSNHHSGLQLFLAALRYFPYLSFESPLLEDKEGHLRAQIDPKYVSLLCKTAKELGFDNEKIRKGCRGSIDDNNFSHDVGISNVNGSAGRMDWRGGKPSVSVFQWLHDRAFLPAICVETKKSDTPQILCVLNDLLRAFFQFEGIQLAEQEDCDAETTMSRSGKVVSSMSEGRWDNEESQITQPPMRRKRQRLLKTSQPSDPRASNASSALSQNMEPKPKRVAKGRTRRNLVIRRMTMREQKATRKLRRKSAAVVSSEADQGKGTQIQYMLADTMPIFGLSPEPEIPNLERSVSVLPLSMPFMHVAVSDTSATPLTPPTAKPPPPVSPGANPFISSAPREVGDFDFEPDVPARVSVVAPLDLAVMSQENSAFVDEATSTANEDLNMLRQATFEPVEIPPAQLDQASDPPIINRAMIDALNEIGIQTDRDWSHSQSRDHDGDELVANTSSMLDDAESDFPELPDVTEQHSRSPPRDPSLDTI